MPHVIVEYTDHLSVDIEKLTIELHHTLCHQPTVKAHAVKTRAMPVKGTVVGEGKDHDKMIHVCLKLLPGRDDKLRKMMAQALYDTTRKIAKDEHFHANIGRMKLEQLCQTEAEQQRAREVARTIYWDLYECHSIASFPPNDEIKKIMRDAYGEPPRELCVPI
jgi:5-carboxymethyl-2-hydroxymuconate isomerase